ncbi:DUF4123 domain-containing protein [Pseudoduganella namucuonensis]|nr:DUF4123 domain-containing protein [Pseudoduganella namucuonensis]
MTTTSDVSSFLLIDSALASEACSQLPLGKNVTPPWLSVVYMRSAARVSPLLIDLLEADLAGQIGLVARVMNALQPRLHVSLIDTALTHRELLHHLRKFIFIKTEADQELTLRFADCAVLPALAEVLTGPQWHALSAPIHRWCIHQLDGSIRALPSTPAEQNSVQTPLVLTDAQIELLREATAVHQLMANYRSMYPSEEGTRKPVDEYRFAAEARRMWHAAGHSDDPTLLYFIHGIFKTNGKIGRLPKMPMILRQSDFKKIRGDIDWLVENQFSS